MAKDVFSKMAEDPWLLKKDGYLNANTDIKEIVYHQQLNVILICTNSGIVRVLDVNTGVVLQSSDLSAQNPGEVRCRYIPENEKVLFCDGQAIGVRTGYNGVVLLDSILQKPILDRKKNAKIDLPLSEAIILKQGLIFTKKEILASGLDYVLEELSKNIANAQKQSKKGIKAQKWNTISLNFQLKTLQDLTRDSVNQMIKEKLNTPELSVASAVHERLSELMEEPGCATKKDTMANEAKRKETFYNWPHMDYKWALPKEMAQAGFYHQPNASGDDRAMCFTCSVCLVCWERTDEPWSEHERHSPACPFVMGEYTQNVPMSVLCATNPATDATYRGTNMKILGTSSLPNLLVTSNSDGLISVFDISEKTRRIHTFFVTQFDSHILEKYTQDFDISGTWSDLHDVKYPAEKRITALSIVSERKAGSTSMSTSDIATSKPAVRPTIVCGLNIRCRSSQKPSYQFPVISSFDQDKNEPTSMEVNEPSSTANTSCLYLVVYDFMYSKESEVRDDNKTEYTPMSDLQHLNGSNTTDENQKNNFIHQDVFEHLSSIYKTLIPGESDEVFLPPPILVSKPQPHSGPRVLPIDMQMTETDSSQSADLIMNQPGEFCFMNGVGHTIPASDNFEKSISDHITELKNSKASKKLNYSRAVQCLSIPFQYKSRQDLDISDIITTRDGSHLLVILKSSGDSNSVMLLYMLDFSNKMVKLHEEPVLVRELACNERPIEVKLLPVIGKSGDFSGKLSKNEVAGNVVMVCSDGAVRIIGLSTLRTICVAQLDNEKFISAAYCNCLERLCASTEAGSMHFYALNDPDNESSEEHEEDDMFGMNVDSNMAVTSSQISDTPENNEMTRCFFEPAEVIPLNDLKRVHELCQFEPLCAGYCAVVPPCWSEIQQAQRQRRYPQNLKAECDQYTKTWRLQTDTTTWDEHIFEITLPSPMSLGHVDVHFSLQTSTALPHVEVTLLRQNTNGIGHKRDVKFAVDENISIDMLQQWAGNPVTTQEYLRAHNADILAGPVNIAAALDLSEQCGVVTLTSPKLFKSRNRTLLLHIKAVYPKDDGTSSSSTRSPKGKRLAENKNQGPSSSSPKSEIYMGCDCIHELSVTVYSSKHVDIPHERTQRNLMLESNPFVESMTKTLVNSTCNEVTHLSLDILTWIASIRLVRNRSNNGECPFQHFEFLNIIEMNMSQLLHQCLLLGDRSIAHKCMKFMITCCSGADDIDETNKTRFELSVQKALLAILDSVNDVRSPAGLQWIFALLVKVSSRNIYQVVSKCVKLLHKLSEDLSSLTNPYHLLLRSRYGLYGTPLELELFDIEPPPYAKGSTIYMTYASAVTGENTTNQSSDFFENFSFNKENINPKDVLSGTEAKLKWRNITPPKIMRGLIETEPLHFSCISASEGTRLERADINYNAVISELFSTTPFQTSATTASTAATTAAQNSLNKKEDLNVFKQFLNELNDEPKTSKVGNSSTSSTNAAQVASSSSHVTWDEDDCHVYIGGLPVSFGSDLLQKLGKIDTMYHNLKSMEHKPVAATPSSKTMWHPENFLSNGCGSVPWHHLLVTPPQQVIVVERMHSGARRFVTLDFGQPILLTDILLPLCTDLVSVSIDIWLNSEETDGTRLVIACDIGSRNLVLNDLQPPPLCRFMKITAVGRYGMTTARCKIPTGYFYGHVVILPEEVSQEIPESPSSAFTSNDLERELLILSKLFEDISCRYSLACSKLKELLRPFLVADMKNASHLATYMSIMKDKVPNCANPEHAKIFTAYQESITYQRQLNTVRHVMTRLEGSLNVLPLYEVSPTISTDKLRAIGEGLLEVLLTLDTTVDIDSDTWHELFQGLCVSQASRLQMLAAIFLDRSCHMNKEWGNFLADTLVAMFSTTNNTRFPQDRVFILLAYLSRRSPERSAVIDAALRVVAKTLSPLQDENRSSLLAVAVDLPLLSWLLIYLSLQLDLCKNSMQSVTRWDWVFGEIMGKASAESANRNGTRKKVIVGKRLGKPEKMDTLDTAHKLVQSSAQALSALSNHAACLNSKLDAALKTQQILMRKAKFKFKDMKGSSQSDPSWTPKKSKDATGTPGGSGTETDKGDKKLPQFIDEMHCLVVAKGLLTLVLSMDHSSSADMLLLAFKVMARLVNMAKIKLGQLMRQDQLMHLINFCLASKIPWAPHALACLLQDVMENELNIDDSSSTSWANNDFLSDVANLCEFTDDESFIDPVTMPIKTSSSSSNQLPSVYESDDSDLEEIVGGFLDKEAAASAAAVKKPIKPPNCAHVTNSVSLDSRLDMSVEATAEINLRKLINKNIQSLLSIVNQPVSTEENDEPIPQWPSFTAPYQAESTVSNNAMLTQCFGTLFENLQMQESANIEHILKLWLTLNCPYKEDKFDPSAVPYIALNEDAVKSVVSAIAWAPGLSLITWTVALQTLTLVCNTNGNSGNDYWAVPHKIAACIVNHPDFVQIFMRLLSGSGLTFIDKVLAGPSLCKALNDFLDRLLMRCYVENSRSKTGKHFKTLLLKVVYQLVQPSGPIALRQGPLDVQCKLIKSMLDVNYSNADPDIAMSIFESTAVLVHSYFVNVDKIKCINIGEKHNVVSTAFNEIFACVMGSDPIKMDLQVSTDVLYLRLLKFLGKLVQTQFREPSDEVEAMDVEPLASSQTDECKAEAIHQDNMRVTNCFADTVLHHHPSIIRLCHALAACKSSSLCMLANVSQKTAFSNISEPNNVGDGVFHVLAVLAKTASDKKLMLPPLLTFLAQAPQLSEPLLWFLLQVLNTEDAIKNFLLTGGIEILGRSFVASSNTPNTISKVGTISTVMQHFSGINPTSDASTAIASASTSRKLQQANIENKLSLINFAPCSTISCPSGTAQPAEVLILGTAATHRRARTPQWSYHFYPDEAHTELTLQLPSAILLREVHLQPHLSALATCPSAVALEVSANGPSRLVPVCPPLPTSGMVFIRLHLPVPEVVNCVLIRLYRPRDANNIGLSQIRLLGNMAFGGGNSIQSLSDNVDDESHCRHSLGWLRLLHHCFILPVDQDLARQVISCASDVPRLLNTCCELLLVPSHVLPVYLPCLEKVMRELSLHTIENSIGAIKTLLNSRSSIIEPLNFADNIWQDKLLINATGYQSACELLYQICEHQDEDTPYRVAMILDWLKTVAREALETGNTQGCNPAYISSIASILWSANQSHISYDLKSMITLEFFTIIYNLKIQVENNIALKYSLDSLLCSLCYIRPELYPVLLQRIGVLVPNLSTDHDASISDDRKDSSMTDDNKRSFEMDSEWYGHLVLGDLSMLKLSNEQLETVALVSRSPSAIQQLLDSGLPKMLNSAILEFCTSTEDGASVPMAKLENVTAILKFFTDVSDEKTMRDWLGSADGSSFWLYLLHWLCKRPFVRKSNLQSEAQAQLEEICVKFLSKCSLCHPPNQARLAKVLCEVIALQTNGISGFMRRLTLQLLLENEKIPVSIKADETLYKSIKMTQAYLPVHPAFKQTYNRALLYLSTNTTLADILEQHIYFNTSYKMETNALGKRKLFSKKDLLKGWFPEDDLSMAAGVTAKDKRAKDVKNQIAAIPQIKKKRYTASESANSNCGDVIGGRLIKCESFSDQALPLNLNLGQLLRLIESNGTTSDWPCIHLLVCQNKNGDKKSESSDLDPSIQQQQPFSSALQVFSSMGGLALLAQHLPTIYPETVRPPPKEKPTSEQSDSEWIKVEGETAMNSGLENLVLFGFFDTIFSMWRSERRLAELDNSVCYSEHKTLPDCKFSTLRDLLQDCDDIYEDVEESIGTSSPSKSSSLISNVPAHSLTAFGLFLRLPGYAEVLLKDMKKALCLLRLVLGVTDDGEGGDIFQSPVADTLPTLPFEVLKKLYDATPLSTDDGRLLRRISINTGVVHLLLACLGIFTHQTQNGGDKDGQKDSKNKEDRSQLYWAKGTGFGTGSTQQSWNVEQALLKQRSEEEHVTVLLQVLASYISPNGEATDELTEDVLPPSFHDLLANSSLLPALSSYLRNDSVLDMARHIPLYRAVLQLLRSLVASSQLVSLLLPQKSRMNEPSISSLLKNMKSCVDTYASKLRINTKPSTKFKTKLREQLEELEQGEGLATLMPDIQETANLVSKMTSGMEFDPDSEGSSSMDRLVFVSLEEKYLKIMKALQFGSFEMISELPEGGVKFIVSHHFESNAKSTGEQSHPARVKRIAQETVTLSTSLPLSYSSSVFVRYDTSRLDVMKVLITGPADTPYANGCFELDVFFPTDYPLSPMMINLETTGHHTIRFNPNLYNDGKVCLSVLNTWHGRPEEKWNAQTSSFLQVLVSIQSLILVPEPYFNEPGYERSRGTPAGTQSSREYNANICQATVRWAMLEQITNPCLCFKDIIHTHFYLKRHEIIAQVEGWIRDLENDVAEKRMSRTANKRSPSANIENFKKIFQELKEQLSKLKPPDGVSEDEGEESPVTTPTNATSAVAIMGPSSATVDSNSINGYEDEELKEVDTDVDMEKMVKDVCGFEPA